MTENVRPLGFYRYEVLGADRAQMIHRIRAVLADDQAVVFAYLFGSFPEGRAFRDIDVSVYVRPQYLEEQEALQVQLDLMGRLEHAAGLPVDIVLLNDAPLGLRLTALRGELIFSRDENGRLAFAERTVLQAMDTAYLRRQSLTDLLTLWTR